MNKAPHQDSVRGFAGKDMGLPHDQVTGSLTQPERLGWCGDDLRIAIITWIECTCEWNGAAISRASKSHQEPQ